jgi:hypothetical protein
MLPAWSLAMSIELPDLLNFIGLALGKHLA